MREAQGKGLRFHKQLSAWVHSCFKVACLMVLEKARGKMTLQGKFIWVKKKFEIYI